MNSIFFNVFLETKFSIQIRLHQFLFEVDRIGNHIDILKNYGPVTMYFPSRKDKNSLGCFSFSHSIKRQKIFFQKLKKIWRSSECAVAVAVQWNVKTQVQIFFSNSMFATFKRMKSIMIKCSCLTEFIDKCV